MAEQELQMDESAQQEELTELERESLMPIDELINSLPPEILEKPASLELSDHSSECAPSEQVSFAVQWRCQISPKYNPLYTALW